MQGSINITGITILSLALVKNDLLGTEQVANAKSQG